MGKPWFVPVTVVTDPALDDDVLRDARDAVLATGDWRPAADLVAATGADLDRRGHRISVLAAAAVTDAGWVDRWLVENPDDPTALLIAGWGAIERARVAPDPDARLRLLMTARTLAERAVDAARDDPVARVPPLWLAVELGESAAVFDRRWSRFTALAPHDRLGHLAAFAHLEQHGSLDELTAFARAAADAAPGTWACVLPLDARLVWQAREDKVALRRSIGAVHVWERDPQAGADLDTAVAFARTAPRHAQALRDLTVLGYALVQALRFAQAHELFTALGHRATPYPWNSTPGPVEMWFGAAADRARRG